MSTTLALVGREEISPTATLEELADLANAEHAEVLGAMRTAVIHAIRAGEALLLARPKVTEGQWLPWLAENFHGAQATAQQYARLAYYKDHILKADASMPLKRAYTYLRGLPSIDGAARKGRKPPPPPETLTEARRLRESGMTYAAIGEVFGVSDSCVRMWLNPQTRKKLNEARIRDYRRRSAARIALQQKEEAKLAKKAGGAISEAYSLLRKTAQALERAAGEAITAEDRAALLDAVQAAHRAEDHVGRALGIQYGSGRARTHVMAKRLAA